MKYEDIQYQKLNIWVSMSSLEQLNNSEYKEELYEKIQIDVPKLNKVKITKTSTFYNEFPNHAFNNLESNGTIDEYQFNLIIDDYHNKTGDIKIQFQDIIKSIKSYYEPFDLTLDLSNVSINGELFFTLINWNKLHQTEFEKHLDEIFNKIELTIKSVDDILNSRSNFERIFKSYVNPRIRYLKSK